MTTNISKQQFTDRVAALVKEFGDSKIRKDAAGEELARLFGPRWVGTLEETLEEPRVICAACKKDEAVSNMSGDDLCYVCAQVDSATA